MEAVLPDAVQAVELGQHDGGDAEALHQLQAVEHPRAREHLAQLGEDPLGRHAGEARGARLRGGDRGVVRLEVQPGGEARQAQDAQRIVARRRSAPAMRRRWAARSSAPPVGSTSGAAAQRLGDRVDGEVAQREVRLDRALAQRGEVDRPAPLRADDAPGAERVRQRERRAAHRQRQVPRRGADVPVDDEVDVDVDVGAGRGP